MCLSPSGRSKGLTQFGKILHSSTQIDGRRQFRWAPSFLLTLAFTTASVHSPSKTSLFLSLSLSAEPMAHLCEGLEVSAIIIHLSLLSALCSLPLSHTHSTRSLLCPLTHTPLLFSLYVSLSLLVSLCSLSLSLSLHTHAHTHTLLCSSYLSALSLSLSHTHTHSYTHSSALCFLSLLCSPHNTHTHTHTTHTPHHTYTAHTLIACPLHTIAIHTHTHTHTTYTHHTHTSYG